jgi:hypothetical protein
MVAIIIVITKTTIEALVNRASVLDCRRPAL